MCEPCSVSSIHVCIQGADGFIISLLAGKKIISISTLQRLWSLRERVTPHLCTHTFAHSQRTYPIVFTCCTLPSLGLSCCLSPTSIEFLSRICHKGREPRAPFAILCHIASFSLLLKALIMSSRIRVSCRPQLNGSLAVISDSLSTWP